MIELATDNDIEMLKKLWLESFEEDSVENVDIFFEKIFSRENTLIYRYGKDIVGALYSLPQSNDMYLYALATATGYRGRGIMSGLIRYFIEKNGKDKGCWLIPEEELLFRYQEDRGFSNRIPVYSYEFANEGVDCCITDVNRIRELSSEVWDRSSILTEFGENVTDYVLAEEANDGMMFYEITSGGGGYYIAEGSKIKQYGMSEANYNIVRPEKKVERYALGYNCSAEEFSGFIPY